MPTSEILKLLQHPGDADRRLVPQLRPLAAWLADCNLDVFDGVVSTDPEALLRSDLTCADSVRKARLIEVFLDSANKGRIEDLGWQQTRFYRHLEYPALSEQLRPILQSRTWSTHVREIAVDIAEACRAQPLGELLADIALDPREPADLRSSAARALITLGDQQASERLKEVLRPGYPGDPNDELRGAALRANWPERLSVVELLAALTPRKRSNFFGSYWLFLHKNPSVDVPDAQLTAALAWVEALELEPDEPEQLERIAAGILLKASRAMDRADVLASLARTVRRRLRHRHWVVSGSLASEFEAALASRDEDRRRLLNAVVNLSDRGDSDGWDVLHATHRLVTPTDLPWLLSRLDERLSEPASDCVATLISRLVDPRDSELMARVKAVADHHPGLRERTAWALTPLPQRLEQRPEPPPDRDVGCSVPIASEIERFLAEAEVGNPEAWWRLTVVLMNGGNSSSELDLRLAVAWASLSTETRKRMHAAARSYLDLASPRPESWIDSGRVYYPAVAGVRALALLRSEDAAVYESIPGCIWSRWASAIVGVRFWSDRSRIEQEVLIGRASELAPEEVADTIALLLTRQSKEPVPMTALGPCTSVWSPRVTQLMHRLIQSSDTTLGAFRELLEFLRARGEPQTEMFVRGLLTGPIPAGEPERQRLIEAAAVVFATMVPGDWELLWPLISSDIELGMLAATRN